MLAWFLDPLAAGLTQIYGRPLGHDVAVVFLLAFVFTVIVAARRGAGSSGVTAAVSVPLMSPSGTRRLLASTATIWREGRGPRPIALALAACVVASLVTLVPVAVGATLVVNGEIVRGVIYMLLGYLWIWMFLGLLPLWVIAGWYEYGFWQSVLGNGLMFVVLTSPEWLMVRAHRAAPTADDVTAHAAANEGAP